MTDEGAYLCSAMKRHGVDAFPVDIFQASRMLGAVTEDLPLTMVIDNACSIHPESANLTQFAARILESADPASLVGRLLDAAAPSLASVFVAGLVAKKIDPSHPLASLKRDDALGVMPPTNLHFSDTRLLCDLGARALQWAGVKSVILFAKSDPLQAWASGAASSDGQTLTIEVEKAAELLRQPLLARLRYSASASSDNGLPWTEPFTMVLSSAHI